MMVQWPINWLRAKWPRPLMFPPRPLTLSCPSFLPYSPVKTMASLNPLWILDFNALLVLVVHLLRSLDAFAFLQQATSFPWSLIISQILRLPHLKFPFALIYVWIFRKSPELSEGCSKEQGWKSKVPTCSQSGQPHITTFLENYLLFN